MYSYNQKNEKSNKLKVVKRRYSHNQKNEKSNKLKVVREGTLIIKRSESQIS